MLMSLRPGENYFQEKIDSQGLAVKMRNRHDDPEGRLRQLIKDSSPTALISASDVTIQRTVSGHAGHFPLGVRPDYPSPMRFWNR